MAPRADRITGEQGNRAFARPVGFRADDGSAAFLTVMWREFGRYEASPSTVFFGTVAADGSTRTTQAVVRVLQGDRLEVKDVASDSKYLTARVVPSPESSDRGIRFLKLNLAVPAGFDREAMSGAVRITLADEKSTVLTIPWSAFVHRPTADSGGQSVVPVGTGKVGKR